MNDFVQMMGIFAIGRFYKGCHLKKNGKLLMGQFWKKMRVFSLYMYMGRFYKIWECFDREGFYSWVFVTWFHPVSYSKLLLWLTVLKQTCKILKGIYEARAFILLHTVYIFIIINSGHILIHNFYHKYHVYSCDWIIIMDIGTRGHVVNCHPL